MGLYTLTASGNVTNAGTATVTSPKLNGNSGDYTLQFNILKVSGTLGGTAQPQTSLDGTVWFNTAGASAYTITDTAGTQSTAWFVENKKGLYYRVLVTGTGTMVGTPSGSLLTIDERA